MKSLLILLIWLVPCISFADHIKVPVLNGKILFHHGTCQVNGLNVITDTTREINAYCAVFGQEGNNKTVFVAVMKRGVGFNPDFVVEVDWAEFANDVWLTQKVIWRKGQVDT